MQHYLEIRFWIIRQLYISYFVNFVLESWILKKTFLHKSHIWKVASKNCKIYLVKLVLSHENTAVLKSFQHHVLVLIFVEAFIGKLIMKLNVVKFYCWSSSVPKQHCYYLMLYIEMHILILSCTDPCWANTGLYIDLDHTNVDILKNHRSCITHLFSFTNCSY